MLALAAGLAAAALALFFAGAMSRRRPDGREGGTGWPVSADHPGAPSPLLRSERWRLYGRPDEVRRLPDGRCVPVEFKSGPCPRRGPPPSHRAQLAGYLALTEEATGRRPPFGVLVYGDGSVWRLPYDARLRADLRSLLEEMRGPSAGAARPAPEKCPGCAYFSICESATA